MEEAEAEPIEVSAAAVGAPTLVGRRELTDAFDVALEAASRGRGTALLAHGAPGSGRSAALEELGIRARLADGLVIQWTAADLTGPPDRLVRELEPSLRSMDPPAAEALAPLVARLAAEDVDAGAAMDVWIHSRSGRLVDLLHELSSHRPVVLLVDDAEAGGPVGLRLLSDLATGVATACLVLLVAGGDPETLGDATVQGFRLSALDAENVEQVVRTSLGPVADVEPLVAWLLDETGGNAAAVVETIRWLAAKGTLRRRRGQWYLAEGLHSSEGAPSPLERLAGRRLELIPEEARDLLRRAALMGPGVDLDLVASALELEALSDELIVQLVRSGLIAQDPTGLWPFRFTQRTLLRRLAEELPSKEKTRVHAALAEALLAREAESTLDTTLQARLGASITWHLLGAGRWKEGAPRALEVAEELASSGDLEGGRKLVAAALASVPARARDTRVGLHMVAGDLERLASHPDAAQASYELALTHAVGAQRSTLDRRLGQLAVARSDYEEGIRRLEAVLHDRGADQAERFEAAHDVAFARMQQSRWDEARDAAEQALRFADRSGLPDAVARALKLRGTIDWMSGQWEDALAENRRALTRFQALGDAHGVAASQMQMGTALRHLARYVEAISCYEDALGAFRQLGLLREAGKCENNLAIVHYFRGEWRQATERFEAFLRVLERTGEQVERVALLNNLGCLYRERGRLERAEQVLTEGLELARTTGARRLEAMALGNLGETLVRRGHWVEAARRLDETLELAEEIEAPDEVLETRRRHFELLALRGVEGLDPEAIQDAILDAQAAGARLEVANLYRLLSQAQRQSLDVVSAAISLERGRQALEGTGAALEARRLRREEAQLLEVRGDHNGARTMLEALLSEFEAMDAGWDLAETAVALGRVSETRKGKGGPRTDVPVEQLEAVTAFARRIGQVHDLQRFLDDTLGKILEVVRADRGLVIAFDPLGRPAAKSVRRSHGDVPDPSEIDFSRSITIDAHRTRKPVIVPVATADRRYRAAGSVAHLGLRTVIAVPIEAASVVRGVIYLDSRTPCDQRLLDAVPLVESLAAVVGASLAHAELLERERSRAEGMAFVVHELKTPLTSVYGYLQMVRMDEDELPDETVECLAIAAEELGRLNRMVVDLHKLSRLEHHGSRQTVASLDVSDLLETVVRNLGGLHTGRELEMVVEVEGQLPKVLGNRDQLIQVVTNLLSNAIKFSPDGARIELTACQMGRASGGGIQDDLGPPVPPSQFLASVQEHVSSVGEVEITVRDSGPGVPEESLDTIFHKFDQAGSSSARSKGLGIGLAIARNIVERHAGRIWAENSPAGGAIFRFTLPALADAPPEDEEEEQ